MIKILSRAAKRAGKAANGELADAHHRLQVKLTKCRPRWRCGSSACAKCAIGGFSAFVRQLTDRLGQNQHFI